VVPGKFSFFYFFSLFQVHLWVLSYLKRNQIEIIRVEHKKDTLVVLFSVLSCAFCFVSFPTVYKKLAKRKEVVIPDHNLTHNWGYIRYTFSFMEEMFFGVTKD